MDSPTPDLGFHMISSLYLGKRKHNFGLEHTGCTITLSHPWIIHFIKALNLDNIIILFLLQCFSYYECGQVPRNAIIFKEQNDVGLHQIVQSFPLTTTFHQLCQHNWCHILCSILPKVIFLYALNVPRELKL